ncbi:phosphotransferase [Defluviimonas sp. WL0002]|uniref:Phosphotransferase n=1 Tax=Albidovulum marisflavi TaxID=2984159 RepID=A0ABT2Z7Y7_9RHOB|nr:phosphotransferase [Defluviimonas sp. WL0002]MCV2867260.1 phosphotransferase [Defluviimonas sp. WL0002]
MAGRDSATTGFLRAAGWADAGRSALAGDASARRYERLLLGERSAILMDAPPEKGEDVSRFTRMASWLLAQGYSAPRLLAEDAASGFLLLEDLGDDLLARIAAADPSREPALYALAVDFLADLGKRRVPDFLQPLDGPALAALLGWVGEWYLPAMGAAPDTVAGLPDTFVRLYRGLAGDRPMVVSLRDFHAENLLWLPNRSGIARLGLLDFQDAVAAHPAYDLVSLLQDARRDVSQLTEAAMIDRFAGDSGWNRDEFGAIYALLGAQRSLRILAVFARLCLHLGRPRYLEFMPRVWGYLARNLAHPALGELAQTLAHLPEPTNADLARLKDHSPCPTP